MRLFSAGVVCLAFCSLAAVPAFAGPRISHERGTARVADSAPAPLQREYSDPSTWGPYGVGVHPLLVPARHQPEPLVSWIWYPAVVDPGDDPYVYIDTPEFDGPMSGTAVEDAPAWPDRDPYPAIAFSHGNGGLGYQSIFLTEHLASHGYVVISCDHPGNTMFDYNPVSMITGAITRPLDISALLDELNRQNLEPNGLLENMIDMDRAGMTGHSFGGYTTLAIAGAQLNLNQPEMRCAKGDKDACLLVNTAHRLGFWDHLINLSDKRVNAAAPLAPLGWEPFRAEGLSYIDIPIQIHGGGLDDTCPMDTEVEPVWVYAQPPKAILEIFDAGHYAYSDMCKAMSDFDECFPPYIDMDYAHELINTWVTSHFKVFLDRDSRYEYFLTEEFAAPYAADVEWRESLGL